MLHLAALLALLLAVPQDDGSTGATTNDPAPVVGLLPEHPEDRAREIFLRADAATLEVKTARYDGSLHGVGSLAGRTAHVEASVIVDRVGAQFGRYLIDGSYHRRGEDGEFRRGEFKAGFDGTEILHLDVTDKTITRLSIGQRGELSSVLMGEFTSGRPFQQEANSDFIEWEGRTLIGDVECHVIYVEYGNTRNTIARWFIGSEDYLPRRVERLTEFDGRPGARVLTVENLQVEYDVSGVVFHPDVPADYTEPRRPPGAPLQPSFRRGF